MTSNAEFLFEKRKNFANYIRQVIKKDSGQIKQLEDASIIDFTSYIVAEMSKYKSNIAAYVKQIMDSNGYKFEDISAEQLKKSLCTLNVLLTWYHNESYLLRIP